MNFLVLGTNHKHSPLDLRERIYFSKKRIKDVLSLLRQDWVLEGAAILSTCNRVEIYASTRYPEQAENHILDFISRYHEVDKSGLIPYLYVYKGKEAIRHLFQVASGLDSQILGESQILGQVKFSLEESCADDTLRNVFHSAISFAKRIHKTTGISEGKISLGTIAVDFIKERVGPLTDKNVLIIGVGKVTELVLKYLKKEGPNIIFISNRTYEKAKEMAGQIGAEVVRFDNLKQYLQSSDIVISATASPHFVLKKGNLKDIKNRLFILDLAVPRDVELSVKELKNISLYSLEDLDEVIKKNIENRLKKAEEVQKIIDIEAQRLWTEFTELEPEPALLP
ncbi:MAG: glutamyl-tRNA reductase [Candidatus Omnitrophica bacterium]|nr:glutamyl-tRNA reductase [Candidatus Omnitrophota bacterium]